MTDLTAIDLLKGALSLISLSCDESSTSTSTSESMRKFLTTCKERLNQVDRSEDRADDLRYSLERILRTDTTGRPSKLEDKLSTQEGKSFLKRDIEEGIETLTQIDTVTRKPDEADTRQAIIRGLNYIMEKLKLITDRYNKACENWKNSISYVFSSISPPTMDKNLDFSPETQHKLAKYLQELKNKTNALESFITISSSISTSAMSINDYNGKYADDLNLLMNEIQDTHQSLKDCESVTLHLHYLFRTRFRELYKKCQNVLEHIRDESFISKEDYPPLYIDRQNVYRMMSRIFDRMDKGLFTKTITEIIMDDEKRYTVIFSDKTIEFVPTEEVKNYCRLIGDFSAFKKIPSLNRIVGISNMCMTTLPCYHLVSFDFSVCRNMSSVEIRSLCEAQIRRDGLPIPGYDKHFDKIY